jgi:hypothetical protein
MRTMTTKTPSPPEPAAGIPTESSGRLSLPEAGDVPVRFPGIGPPEKVTPAKNPVGNPRKVTVTHGNLKTRFGGGVTLTGTLYEGYKNGIADPAAKPEGLEGMYSWHTAFVEPTYSLCTGHVQVKTGPIQVNTAKYR